MAGQYAIQELDDDVVIERLTLAPEDDALNGYLLSDCKKDHVEHFAKTYVCVDRSVEVPRPVVGYITLLACHVTNQHVKPYVEQGNDLAEYSFNYPAIKIARLAVDANHRGNDLGRKLVALACAISVEVMGQVGCRLIAVDANKPAIAFYQKSDFKLLNSPKNLTKDNPFMYLDLHLSVLKDALPAPDDARFASGEQDAEAKS